MDQNNEPTTPAGTPNDAPETAAAAPTVAGPADVAAHVPAPTPAPTVDAQQQSNAVALNQQPAQAVAVPGAAPAAQAHTLQKVYEQVPADGQPAANTAAPSSTPTAAGDINAATVPPAAAPTKPARTASETFRRRSVGLLIGGVAACAIALGGGGFALGATLAVTNAQTSNTITSVPQTYTPGTSGGSTGGSTGDSGTTIPQQASPFGGSDSSSGTGSSTGTATTTATPATDAQKEGVVTIVSSLYYSDTSKAAGTGVILTSNGEILTNNHVIDGATSIEVTVESTGKTYVANVVGVDATNDVALLQLVGASGLTPSTTDDSTLSVGDEATSVGNAEGTGDLVAAAGTITALEQSITVGNEYTGGSESLSNLIEIDADVVSGDSGGPLVDADGDVIGIVTAASSGSANITGFAIPIETALDIVNVIKSGVESGTVKIGASAFLGIQLATANSTTPTSTGVPVGGVIAGTPAETAGLAAGDIITAIDGTNVSSADALSAAVATHDVGDSVTVTYTNAAGTSQTVTVTLMAGPAS
ncbi:MAG: hypothetical protein JWQ43_2115 [Glaciihabitans sp.]|nr:hypothetical protein [Glaciihabitans sp.]